MVYTPNIQNAKSEEPNRWFGEVFGALTANLSAAQLTAVQSALVSAGLPATATDFADLNFPDHQKTVLQAITVVMQQMALIGFGPRHDFSGSLSITVNLDETEGFAPASFVLDDQGDLYVCTDSSEGAAAWLMVYED